MSKGKVSNWERLQAGHLNVRYDKPTARLDKGDYIYLSAEVMNWLKDHSSADEEQLTVQTYLDKNNPKRVALQTCEPKEVGSLLVTFRGISRFRFKKILSIDELEEGELWAIPVKFAPKQNMAVLCFDMAKKESKYARHR